ncbi:hypothetical protein AB0F43_06450 [Kribbella sp. NPDC023972]|uniref:hypothetical protein n=1 Tax=Kribbella sp. NPDC023972 TaxID=3154795 RepID=UPI0033C17B46
MALAWSLSSVILMLILAALTGAVVAMVSLADPNGPTRHPRDRRRIVAASTVLTGVGTVSFVGLGTLLGAPTAVLLLAIIVGGSPYAIRYCVRWLTEHGHLAGPAAQPHRAERSSRTAMSPVPEIGPDDASKPGVAPEALSDEALCLAWRASFSALQRASSPTQRSRVVEERRAYLDEIERRTANGMAAWLASGARAAGDPSRFVLGDSAVGRARIDWDDLLLDMDK